MGNIYLVRSGDGRIDCTCCLRPDATPMKPGKKKGPHGEHIISQADADRFNSLARMAGPTIELAEAHIKVGAAEVEVIAGPFPCETVQGDCAEYPLMTATKITTPKGFIKWSNAKASYIDAKGNILGRSVVRALMKVLGKN